MPNMFMLIGVPGSGKSTWIENLRHTMPGVYLYPVISTDRYIEDAAQRVGKTYTEVYSDEIESATRKADDRLKFLVEEGEDFIWDQTNLTVMARDEKLKRLRKSLRSYRKFAVFFLTPPPEVHQRRLSNRPDKKIPDGVISSMITRLQLPQWEEGWDEIWFYDSVTNYTYEVKKDR